MEIKLHYGDTLNINNRVYEYERGQYKLCNSCCGCDLYRRLDEPGECNIDCGNYGIMVDVTPKAIILCPHCNFDEHEKGEDGNLVCKECDGEFIIGI
jgi:hypothetical protein